MAWFPSRAAPAGADADAPAPAGAKSAAPPAPAPPPIPPAVTRPVDFEKDVVPILQTSCAQCHANGKAKGKLKLESRATILKGGEDGPAAVEGHSERSLMIRLVAGQEPDRLMPKNGHPLSVEQIGVLRAWIDGGLKWPEGYVLSQWKQAPLAPRRVPLPPAEGPAAHANPIDRLLAPYFRAHHVTPPAIVGDRVFARRAWLDVVGLLPPPAELEAFAADAAPDKRAKLVRRLLGLLDDGGDHGDFRAAYAEHWLSFWNDLLRNDYRGTGYIDGGRKQITPWLYSALYHNLPYDQFIRELVTGANGAEGFIKGIVWRGVVNAAQTPQMQASQNISQVFMGVNLKCASCHDSFVSDWKLADSYGLAAIYADAPLEMERCGVAQGQFAPMHFLYPQLGTIDAKAPKATRVRQLADAITSKDNGRLTRTIVNRLWQRFLGRGLVEPVDDLDADPWDGDLLDWLAGDLTDHGYDLKHTMELILTSRAYQLPAVVEKDESTATYAFAGPKVRRMSAEQFVDALATVAGVPPGSPAVKLAATGEVLGEQQKKDAKKDAKHPAQAAGTVAPLPPRAAACPADPLTTALGRPNREVVLTQRPSAATTLQALELTNGGTLANMLHQGAVKYAADKSLSASDLVKKLYATALGRPPMPAELAAATAAIGSPVTAEGVEDLLWVMAMLPEFQLIR